MKPIRAAFQPASGFAVSSGLTRRALPALLAADLERTSDAPRALQLLVTRKAGTAFPNGLDGRQLADEARRRWPDVKVLFTTAYARNAIVHHGRLDPNVELADARRSLRTAAAAGGSRDK